MTGIQVANLRGLRVRLHPSAIGAVVLIAVSLAFTSRAITHGVVGALSFGLIGLALVVSTVVIVQLAQATAAQSIGFRVRAITFFFTSGVPQLERDETERIAGHGPGGIAFLACVTPVLHAVLGATLGAFASVSVTQHTLLDGLTTALASELSPALVLVAAVAATNLSIAVVSLLPAHPLEGGRLLQAALWKLTGDRARALSIAQKVGVFVGVSCLVASLVVFARAAHDGLPRARVMSSVWLSLLGAFLVARGTRLAAKASVAEPDHMRRTS